MLTREQLGIVDSDKDVYETADVAVPGGETQQLLGELEAGQKSLSDNRAGLPAPIDRAPLEPAAARSFFQTVDAVSRPPETDFSHAAHERRRTEWRILGDCQHARRLETPFDRYTRLVAEAQALHR